MKTKIYELYFDDGENDMTEYYSSYKKAYEQAQRAAYKATIVSYYITYKNIFDVLNNHARKSDYQILWESDETLLYD